MIDLNLFNYYFKYSYPSNMYKKLVDTKNNKVKVYFIKDYLTNSKEGIENVSKDDVDKIELKMDKIVDIVELIFYFNDEDQQ